VPKVIRVVVDDAQSHSYSPVGVVAAYSPADVYVNGSAIARVGDLYSPATHCSGSDCHTIGAAAAGSANVYADGKKVHRYNDGIDCGAKAGHGSDDVFANGANA